MRFGEEGFGRCFVEGNWRRMCREGRFEKELCAELQKERFREKFVGRIFGRSLVKGVRGRVVEKEVWEGCWGRSFVEGYLGRGWREGGSKKVFCAGFQKRRFERSLGRNFGKGVEEGRRLKIDDDGNGISPVFVVLHAQPFSPVLLDSNQHLTTIDYLVLHCKKYESDQYTDTIKFEIEKSETERLCWRMSSSIM